MSTPKKEVSLVEIKKEINEKIGDQETFSALVQTTFSGLEPQLVKRAMMEGMMRGFKFGDFLERNVYAIPFRNNQTQQMTYTLVTSIDYARKLGMRGGVVGKSKPEYEYDDKGNVSECTIGVEKLTNGERGWFYATVDFDEYNTGKNQWKSKPKTMIAKVAEMHALRMACPEEASQMYIEEEYEKEAVAAVQEPTTQAEKEELVLSEIERTNEIDQLITISEAVDKQKFSKKFKTKVKKLTTDKVSELENADQSQS